MESQLDSINQKSRTKILIAEDDSIVAMQIKKVIQKLGYEVAGVASRSEEALKIAAEKSLHLVLMDIRLAGETDGIETAYKLKSMYNVPLIFLTSYSDEVTIERAKKAEPAGYILKPFEIKELSTSIEIALYKHNIEKRLRESEELYRALVDNTHDGILILQQGKIVYFNCAFQNLMGMSKEELTDQDLLNILEEESRTVLVEKYGSLQVNDFPLREYELKVRNKKNNKSLLLSVNLSSINYSGHEAIMGTVKDITEKKQAEEQLKKNEEILKLKLDYILSQGKEDEELNIFELIDMEKLQKIQDAFADALNVASFITDKDGSPVTKPSNENKVCAILKNIPEGKLACMETSRCLGLDAAKEMKPSIHTCCSGGFVSAAAPIIVAGKHIANWLIIENNTYNVEKEKVLSFAAVLGANMDEVAREFDLIPAQDKGSFDKTLLLLWEFAREISLLAYNNIKLARELTDRKKAQSDLYRSEVRNSAVLNSIPDSLFQITEQGIISNAKMKSEIGPFLMSEITEYKKAEEVFPAELAELLVKNVKNALTLKKKQKFEYPLENAQVLRYFEFRVILFGNRETLVMMRDVTNRKKEEKELIEAKEKAEKSDRLKSEFLAQVSHEIRTTINVILSFASLMKFELEDKLPEGLEDSFRIIDAAGRRLIRTIDEILEMSELQTGSYELNPETIDLETEILQSLLAEYQYIAKNKQINLVYNKRTDGATINADKHMIMKIFANIIDNAIKYTPEGEVE
ncbi:MAG: PocR ligand-binding domain-containing protein, partial [Methanococcaceae archaeon]